MSSGCIGVPSTLLKRPNFYPREAYQPCCPRGRSVSLPYVEASNPRTSMMRIQILLADETMSLACYASFIQRALQGTRNGSKAAYNSLEGL